MGVNCPGYCLGDGVVPWRVKSTVVTVVTTDHDCL